MAKKENDEKRIKWKWDEKGDKGNYQIDGVDFDYPGGPPDWDDELSLTRDEDFEDDVNAVIRKIDSAEKLPENVRVQLAGLIATMVNELGRLHNRMDKLNKKLKSHSHVSREVDFVEIKEDD